MVKEFTETLLEKLEFANYSVTIPEVFDDLYSADANFETATSNTIQSLKIFYKFNIVTHKIAVVFVNGVWLPGWRRDVLPSAKLAVDLLKDKLDFTDVNMYVDLSKSQMIEKLDMIQCEVDEFERKKAKPKTKHAEKKTTDKPPKKEWLLVVAIFNIGFIIPWMTRKERKGREEEWESQVSTPQISEDHS